MLSVLACELFFSDAPGLLCFDCARFMEGVEIGIAALELTPR